MSRKQILKEGAIIVSDVHYAPYRRTFEALVHALETGKIETKQLILLGDIFDLLMGPITAFKKVNKSMIQRLNRLSESMEIIYFEGNHDFHLASIFPFMQVIPLSQQPVAMKHENQTIWFAHGDWNGPILYRIFTAIVRNRIVLSCLNLLDIVLGQKISKKLMLTKENKSICSPDIYVQEAIDKRFQNRAYSEAIFIEGHFHLEQERWFDTLLYHNIGAMACNQSYFVVQSNNNVIRVLKKPLKELYVES